MDGENGGFKSAQMEIGHGFDRLIGEGEGAEVAAGFYGEGVWGGVVDNDSEDGGPDGIYG